jgi:hypothetical protein
VLHDPLLADDAQIAGASAGAAAERNEANNQYRHHDRRGCTFEKIQGHFLLAWQKA